MVMVKLFLSDIDGTLTDGGMYYGLNGECLKRFNTRDGHGFGMLKDLGIYTGVVTSEVSKITQARFVKKLDLNYVGEGLSGFKKLEFVNKLVKEIGISLDNVAYIGDDVNCLQILSAVGYKACPVDAHKLVCSLPQIEIMKKPGGKGCVREFIDQLLDEGKVRSTTV